MQIAIPITDEKLALDCIVEELAQSMGLQSDQWSVQNTAFQHDPDKGALDLTDWDRLALWVLYDPRLRAGMSPEEGYRTANTILSEIEH